VHLVGSHRLSNFRHLSNLATLTIEYSKDKDKDQEDEDDDEPTAASPSSQDPVDMVDFEYDPGDPAFLKDTHFGIQDMTDKQAYSVLLGLARVAAKEKEWKTHLILAAKSTGGKVNAQAFSNNRSTRAQDRAHWDATRWVSYVSMCAASRIALNPDVCVGHR
jgi:hypothetical protein